MSLHLQPADRSLPSLTTEHVPVIIGRGDEADLQITNRFASRRHCAIDDEGGHLVLRDLGSRHGTYVNGKRVDVIRLQQGDEIQIGLDRILVEFADQNLPAASGS